ncbi:MAG: choice-of-anchor D domain-containing protein [Thermoguttaceae bacterium]|jgi:autotransporter-associated beta strand protein
MTTSPANGGTLLFSKTLVGHSSTAKFTVTNNSTASMGGGFTGSFPAASAPFSPTTSQSFNVAVPTGASSPYTFLLPPNVVSVDGGTASVSATYTFAPTVRGTSSQKITFKPTAGFIITTTPSSTITLSGQAVAPVVSLNTANVAVGNVRIGTSGTASFSIANVGDGNQAGAGLGNLTGTVASSSGTFAGPGGSLNLADSGSQSFLYTATPTAHGAVSAVIAINTTDGSSDGRNLAQSLSATLTGTGVGPTISTSLSAGSTINLGRLADSLASSQTLTVSNVTTDPDLGALTNLDVLGVSLSGANAGMFQVSGIAPGTILSKGKVGNLQVTLQPSLGAAGVENATLTIQTDQGAASGAAGASISFPLTGTAISPAYWKGTFGSSWNTSLPGFNWTLAASSTAQVSQLPNAFTDVYMPASGATNTATTLGQDFSIDSLNFTSGTAAMSVGGSNTLTLAAGITVSGGTATQTISSGVILGASQVWMVNGRLAVTGSINGAAGVVLTKSGSGTLVLSGSDSYLGGTVVTAGMLDVAQGSALAAGSSLTVGAGGTFLFDPSQTTVSPLISAGAAAVPEPGTLTLLVAAALAALAASRHRGN